MTGFIVSVFPFRNCVSPKEAFEGLELGEGKPSRPVLRGPGGRKAAWLLGSYGSSVGLVPLDASALPDARSKRACIDQSGHLPGGRQLEGYSLTFRLCPAGQRLSAPLVPLERFAIRLKRRWIASRADEVRTHDPAEVHLPIRSREFVQRFHASKYWSQIETDGAPHIAATRPQSRGFRYNSRNRDKSADWLAERGGNPTVSVSPLKHWPKLA
jgi:hypothetical protein